MSPSRPQPRLAEVSPAWRELWALACAMRPEWDQVDWQALGGPGLTAEERAELRAKAFGACEAASEQFAAQRRSGPMPQVRERDP